MPNRDRRPILGTIVVLLSAAIWGYGLQWSALLNFIAGPLNGLLSARAAVLFRGTPAGGQVRLVGLALYAGVLVVVAAGLAAGVVPVVEGGVRPSFSTVFLGVHGEGLLGLFGLLAGAGVALLAYKSQRVGTEVADR